MAGEEGFSNPIRALTLMKEWKNVVGAALVSAADELVRARVTIRGAVQGVGFRPCVFRLATELGLSGWVNNSAEGVFIELEGRRAQVERFILRIESEKPLRSFIQSLETSWLEPAGYTRFEIRASDSRGAKTALVLPDIAICPDCLREIFDPGDRRYLLCAGSRCVRGAARNTRIRWIAVSMPSRMRALTVGPTSSCGNRSPGKHCAPTILPSKKPGRRFATAEFWP